MALIPAGNILENRHDLPILLLIEPDVMRVHIAVLIVILIVEAHLPQNVLLLMPLRGELIVGVVLLEEAVAVFVALKHGQDACFQVV